MIASLTVLLPAGGALALVAPAAVTRPRPTVEANTTRCSGGLHQVHTVRRHHSSRLVAVDPDTGRTRWDTGLDHTVNAIGYDATQHLFIGVATRRNGHPIGDGGHIVAITPEGETRDLGPVRAGSGSKRTIPVAGAYVAAIADGRLLLLLDGDLVAVDVRPGSTSFLRVIRRTDLPRLPSFGDWDVRPGDGALYRITVDGAATRLARSPGLLGSDAAWCRALPRPPAPSPSATTSPPASPTPAADRQSAAVPPPGPPPVLRRPIRSTSRRPPATTPPPPPPVEVVHAPRKSPAAVKPQEDHRTTTVRFGIVLLVLGLGGVAFARPVARGR
ncbi:hypothetical protein [Micromonospora sp. CPCC 206061]|uniref:hypothetical protein n=1 Tax=Micromonospora sp. CPCC 206061 TaxID=3122410 RepID=UPI002FEF8814